MPAITILDLLTDWRRRRAVLKREIDFWECRPGTKPAPSLKTLRQQVRQLDRLILRYAISA